jgi:hypothetical protein
MTDKDRMYWAVGKLLLTGEIDAADLLDMDIDRFEAGLLAQLEVARRDNALRPEHLRRQMARG